MSVVSSQVQWFCHVQKKILVLSTAHPYHLSASSPIMFPESCGAQGQGDVVETDSIFHLWLNTPLTFIL